MRCQTLTLKHKSFNLRNSNYLLTNDFKSRASQDVFVIFVKTAIYLIAKAFMKNYLYNYIFTVFMLAKNFILNYSDKYQIIALIYFESVGINELEFISAN